MAELREMARDEIGRQKKADGETAKRTTIMRALLAKVECELPQSLVRAKTQNVLNDIVRENQARGVADDVLKENEKELVGTAAASAREQLKGTFVLLRIAEKEGITRDARGVVRTRRRDGRALPDDFRQNGQGTGQARGARTDPGGTADRQGP